MTEVKRGLSDRTKAVITLIFLFATIFSPIFGLIGVILMWLWVKWPKWVKILITAPFAAFFIFLIFFFTHLFLVRPYQVIGNAMEPNYNNGAYLITRLLNPKGAKIERGEVIIFKFPENSEQKIIGRVIALPGETVMLQEGSVYINGQKLDENNYLAPGVQTNGGAFIGEGRAMVVPQEQYFVLGDNRPSSIDSRKWGFIPKESIISKVKFCYWNCK